MKTFKELKRNLKIDISNKPSYRVALLGDSATQFLSVALQGMAIERGFSLDIFEADYSQIQMQVMNPSSELHSFNADFVIIFQSTHKLLEKYSLSAPSQYIQVFEERLAFIKSLPNLLDSQIIYYNYPEIDDSIFGSFSNSIEESFLFQLRKLNVALMELSVSTPKFHICDLSSVQNKYGRNFIYPAAIYMTTELLISLDALPHIASRTIDIIAAIKGSFKKCLILDLDNTLWGGIIGDDGIENIQIGHGLGIGKAFTEFQEWIKKLQQRGIILAICSKNTESIAKEPFEKHSEMILKLSDIAIFVANWNSKVENIIHIQKVLNIGFDSMVFLDDNPYERNVVREQIPLLTVPELPKDPAEYLEYLYGLNLFETASFSNADINRTKQYQVEAKRAELKQSFTSEQDFLKNLEMKSTIEEPGSFNIPRIAQLSQRSNQFNLRTIRYSEDDVKKFQNNPNQFCFAFTLEDKFGDNGLVSVVVISKKDEKTAFIDNWFMSCRVLKRGMENFVLNHIVSVCKKKGFLQLIGEYIPTTKNALVSTHYESMGFTSTEEHNRKLFFLNLSTFEPRETFISANRGN